MPTAQFTGELYVRWFQFGAFCPLFRSHGRTWHLRLPWGWNRRNRTGRGLDVCRCGIASSDGIAQRGEVEPICRKYLELRYRLMPYLYSAVRETAATGLPIMRALWLHYSEDPTAVARGDQFLWGRDILVAPVVEKGATSRKVYLPGEVVRLLDGTGGRRRRGNRSRRRSRDHAALRRGRAIVPMGPVEAIPLSRSTDR